MQNTSKILEVRCTATIHHEAPNLQTSQCAGGENTEPHTLKGEGETEASSPDVEKSKRILSPGQDLPQAQTHQHTIPLCPCSDPTASMLLPRQNQIVKEGQQEQNTHAILQRYNGFSHTSPPFVGRPLLPSSSHTPPHGRIFTSLRNQPSS